MEGKELTHTVKQVEICSYSIGIPSLPPPSYLEPADGIKQVFERVQCVFFCHRPALHFGVGGRGWVPPLGGREGGREGGRNGQWDGFKRSPARIPLPRLDSLLWGWKARMGLTTGREGGKEGGREAGMEGEGDGPITGEDHGCCCRGEKRLYTTASNTNTCKDPPHSPSLPPSLPCYPPQNAPPRDNSSPPHSVAPHPLWSAPPRTPTATLHPSSPIPPPP